MLIKTVRSHHSHPALVWLKWTLTPRMPDWDDLNDPSIECSPSFNIMRIWCQISFATHGCQMPNVTYSYKEALQLRGTKTFFCLTNQSYEDLPGFKVLLVLNVIYLNLGSGKWWWWRAVWGMRKRMGNQY